MSPPPALPPPYLDRRSFTALVVASSAAALLAELLPFASESRAQRMIAVDLAKGRSASRTVRVGEVVEVRLPAIPSTGYSWQVETSNPNVLAVGDRRFENKSNDAPRVGSEATQVITLKAVGEGRAEVLLIYRRPWEKRSASDDTSALSVTVTK